MDEGWIITTAITFGYWRNLIFFKKNHEPVGLHSPAASKIERDSVTKADLKETTDELKKDINKIREDYTPRRLTARILMGARRRLRRSGRIT